MIILSRGLRMWEALCSVLGAAILLGLTCFVNPLRQESIAADDPAQTPPRLDARAAVADFGTASDELTLRGEPRPVVSAAVAFSPDGHGFSPWIMP
jgi:hypothetical protein